MIDEIKMAFSSQALLALAAVALVLGLIFGKGKRKLFLIPSIIITAVIVNPLFYNFWYKFNSRAYWRTLWIIPVVCLCSFVPALLVDKAKKDISKTATVMIGAAAVAFFGVFAYTGDKFVEANNADKLPNDVVAVAEALLELDDEPYVVADASLSQYLRQYSGKIKSLYGRDAVYGSINSQVAKDVYSNIYEDLSIVAFNMLNYDYEYLITDNSTVERKNALDASKFELVRQINNYGIYKATGNPQEVRTYNELHQITSITTVNENGEPVENSQGYSTVMFTYDYRHRIAQTTYFDVEGMLTDTVDGIATVKYMYNGNSNKTALTYYFDKNNRQLELGSGFLHDYLQGLLLERDYSIIIMAVKDEASEGITEALEDDLRQLGIRNELTGEYRKSFYAVILPDSTEDDISSDKITSNGEYAGVNYSVLSGGSLNCNESSICIDGIEYSENVRGINIVVYNYDDHSLIDSIGFDTATNLMRVSHYTKE